MTRLISNKAKIFIISQAHASIFSVLFSLIMMHLSFFSVAAQTTEGQVELESLFLPFFFAHNVDLPDAKSEHEIVRTLNWFIEKNSGEVWS